MVSDEEIVERLKSILSSADLNVLTIKMVKAQLEGEYGIDLTAKKKLLRVEVERYLEEQKAQDDEEEEEEDEEEQEKPKKTKRVKKEKKKRKKGGDGEGGGGGGGGGGGLNKMCALSDDLAALIGVNEAPRTEVVKKIWAYIKEHNLQDPSNKRVIICDKALERLFKKASTDMFQMNKLLSDHIFSIPGPNGELPEKKPKPERGERGGSLSNPQVLSPALTTFLGGETHMKRTEVVKAVWSYIKEHGLQDPADKRRIICDDKLKSLFEVDNFNGFGMTKLLIPHYVKEVTSQVNPEIKHEAPPDANGDDLEGDAEDLGEEVISDDEE